MGASTLSFNSIAIVNEQRSGNFPRDEPQYVNLRIAALNCSSKSTTFVDVSEPSFRPVDVGLSSKSVKDSVGGTAGKPETSKRNRSNG